MPDPAQIYLAMLEEHQQYARHHEEHREKATNIILLIAGGLFSISNLKEADVFTLPLSLFITLLGSYGAVMSAKHYERSQFHMQRGRELRAELDQTVPGLRLNALNGRADAVSKRDFPRIFDWRLFRMWIGIHVMIAVGGICQMGFGIYRLATEAPKPTTTAITPTAAQESPARVVPTEQSP